MSLYRCRLGRFLVEPESGAELFTAIGGIPNPMDRVESVMRRPTAASNVAGQVGGSAPLELLARAGLTAYGLIHILVGWLALLMAWGGSAGESSDLSGALRTVARQPFGKIMLGQVAGGLVALALWQADRKGYMP
ncbi:MAG: DUF1206 domain-containing protein, partial [Acidimicrobiia bacterium]